MENIDKIFNDTETAFALKSNAQLRKAYYLFKLIQSPGLVKTGAFLANMVIKLHLPFKWAIKKTVFSQFCGGITEGECVPVIEKMHTKGVDSVLDYSVEGQETEEQFDHVANKIIDLISLSTKIDGMPLAVFKPTGTGRFDIYRKVTAKETLDEQEKKEWQNIVDRYDRICRAAFDHNVPVMIDAEHSWIQDAVDDLTEVLMEKYNKEQAIVYGTLQMYRWDRMDYLRNLHQRAKEKGYHIGMKLVRGAYMEKERIRAEEKGYHSPICATKEDTDRNYNEASLYMMQHIDTMAIFLGTHNEESSLILVKSMIENNFPKGDKRIFFSQLYGMSDHISYNLGARGFRVAKYLPFGPIADVLPYLIRRTEENSSIAGQTCRELSLLTEEKNRRKNTRK